MNNDSYTTSFVVDQSPAEVFAAISNVRAWWTGEITGRSEKLGDEFTYRYEDMHVSTQRVTELVPDEKIVWHVVDATLNFVKDKSEWTGTDIVFDIASTGGKTELRFTHLGLVPAFECFDDCRNGWGFYVGTSLRHFITTGKAEAAE